MLRQKDNKVEFLKYFDKRRSNCAKCGHRV